MNTTGKTRVRRRIGPPLLILVLGFFAGIAWLTQNAASPWVEQAQEWPVLGGLATRFRQAYLGRDTPPEPPKAASSEPASSEPASSEPAPRQLSQPHRPRASPTATRDEGLTPAAEPASAAPVERGFRPPVRLGAVTPPEPREAAAATPTAAPSPAPPRDTPSLLSHSRVQYLAQEWLWFVPGNRIQAAALEEATVEAELSAMAYLPVLARNGPWAEVMYRDNRGWIDTSWQPSYRRRDARRGLLRHRYEPVQRSDPSRLAAARKMLRIKKSEVRVGAYTLYTDVEDEALLAFLDSTAVAAEKAYLARYGRLPSGDPHRSAVLFAAEADYRRYYAEAWSAASANTQSGHAERGILAFYAEGRSRVTLARTLVHEIGHLLNARALAWNLPPWLEEGLATDLGSVWVERSLEVVSDPRVGNESSLVIQGFDSRIFLLESVLKEDGLPSIGALLSLDRETFQRPGVQAYAYAHSAAFIRYLLDSDEGLADGFRAFLKRIAGGTRAYLLKSLDRSIEDLDRGFRSWLTAEAQTHRETLIKQAENRHRR